MFPNLNLNFLSQRPKSKKPGLLQRFKTWASERTEYDRRLVFGGFIAIRVALTLLFGPMAMPCLSLALVLIMGIGGLAATIDATGGLGYVKLAGSCAMGALTGGGFF